MAKKKYDRKALKVEFIESEYEEVKQFFQDKFNIYNWEIAKNTKGRAKKKQEVKERIVEKAIDKHIKKQVNELQVPIEDLMKWKKDILKLLLLKVSNLIEASEEKNGKTNIDVWDAERILKMFKTELGEPATIGANYNMNANKVEWLTEEELKALDILFWNSQNGQKSNE